MGGRGGKSLLFVVSTNLFSGNTVGVLLVANVPGSAGKSLVEVRFRSRITSFFCGLIRAFSISTSGAGVSLCARIAFLAGGSLCARITLLARIAFQSLRATDICTRHSRHIGFAGCPRQVARRIHSGRVIPAVLSICAVGSILPIRSTGDRKVKHSIRLGAAVVHCGIATGGTGGHSSDTDSSSSAISAILALLTGGALNGAVILPHLAIPNVNVIGGSGANTISVTNRRRRNARFKG